MSYRLDVAVKVYLPYLLTVKKEDLSYSLATRVIKEMKTFQDNKAG